MEKITLFMVMMLILAAAVNAISVQLAITANGVNNVVVQNQTTYENCSQAPANDTNQTTQSCVNQTVTVNQTQAQPWSSSQQIQLDCDVSCNYDIPTFNVPQTVSIKNYTIDYARNENYTIVFKETNTTLTTDSGDKIHIDVAPPTSETIIQIGKITPKNISLGTNQVNILIINTFNEPLSSITADISGQGIETISAIPIQSLAVGDKDYVFLTINATDSGTKDIIIKVTAQTTTQIFNINSIDQLIVAAPVNQTSPATQNSYNTSAISDQINSYNNLINQYQSEYLDKKAKGYLVSEIYDLIKDARNNLETAQTSFYGGKYKDAIGYLEVVKSDLDNINSELQQARMSQQSFTDILKGNAVLITTVIAALAALGGIIERYVKRVKKLKERLRMRKAKEKKLIRKVKKLRKIARKAVAKKNSDDNIDISGLQ